LLAEKLSVKVMLPELAVAKPSRAERWRQSTAVPMLLLGGPNFLGSLEHIAIQPGALLTIGGQPENPSVFEGTENSDHTSGLLGPEYPNNLGTVLDVTTLANDTSGSTTAGWGYGEPHALLSTTAIGVGLPGEVDFVTPNQA
jgi:hypothetical protein